MFMYWMYDVIVRNKQKQISVWEDKDVMLREQLVIELRKMFCNYIQESNDMTTFYEVALNYVEEQMALNLDYDKDFEEAMEMIEDTIAGR